MLKTALASIILCLSTTTSVFAAPILDAAFGASGIVRVGAPSGREDTINASTIQPDGKVLVAGISSGRGTNGFVTRFTQSGVPDPTFGNSGTQSLAIEAATFLLPESVHVLANGSIMVLSLALSDMPGYALTRLSADGSVDTGFGTGGTVVFDTGPVLRGIYEIPVAAVPQPDGKIVVVIDASPMLRFRRFLANGLPDPAYGPDGVRTVTNLPANFRLSSQRLAQVEPGGGVTLVARSTFNPGSYLVMRFTAEAMLDPSFNGIGYASGVDLGNPTDFPIVLARGSDGNYAILGWNTFSAATDNVVWRFDARGKSIRTFGVNGRLSVGGPTVPGIPAEMALAALPDGDVVVALRRPDAMARVARFNATAAPRASFGVNGVLDIVVPGYLAFRPAGLEYDANGRLFVVGNGHSWTTMNNSARGADGLLVSLSSTGSPTADFGGGDGMAIANLPMVSNDTIDALLVDSSGRITAVGYTDAERRTDLLVTRMLPNGAYDSTFGTAGRLTPSFALDWVGAARATALQGDSIIAATANTVGLGVDDSTRMIRIENGVREQAFNPTLDAGGRSSTIGVAARTDGRIVYLGESSVRAVGMTSYVVQQLLPDGSPDPGFGTNGRVAIPSSQFNDPFWGDVVLLDDGSIVAAMFPNGLSQRLYKLNSAGAVDPEFGSAAAPLPGTSETSASRNPRLLALRDGTFVTLVVTYRFVASGTAQTLWVRRFSSTGRQLSVQSLETTSGAFAATALADGSVLIGRTLNASSTTVARLLPNDAFDQAFGGVAGTRVPFASITALAASAGGKLVVGGQDASSAVVARYSVDGATATVGVVEFFNVNLRHYFDTAGVAEIASIETGGAGPGWQRTGNDFRGWTAESGVPLGAVPVCRFYGTPGRGPNSHFYTANQKECAMVRQDAGWTYEGTAFFAVPVQAGGCPGSTVPVYRAYNNGFAANDSNHRYSTDLRMLTAMAQQGWTMEGLVFCGGSN